MSVLPFDGVAFAVLPSFFTTVGTGKALALPSIKNALMNEGSAKGLLTATGDTPLLSRATLPRSWFDNSVEWKTLRARR